MYPYGAYRKFGCAATVVVVALCAGCDMSARNKPNNGVLRTLNDPRVLEQQQEPRRPITLAALNTMSEDDFTAALEGIYEHSSWIPRRAHARAPFASATALAAAMVDVVRRASRTEQLELLRAYPELAGKEAQAGGLSDHSSAEHRGAGLVNLSDEEKRSLAELNAAYRTRFGFPFIIAVKNHTKASILAELRRRNGNDADTEFSTCLEQMHHIARFRLDALLGI